MNPLKRDLIIREPLLVSALILLTVAFSTLTHAYNKAYDRRRTSLGAEWFERGKLELKNNRPSVAVEDFRTALLYNSRNANFRLYLANALAQSGLTEQAFNYYLGLWQNMPTSGPVNLELARLSEQKGDFTSAERFFNGAIFGDWPEDATASRRTASFELINSYLKKGDSGHAESQLIILSDNLPEDPQLHSRVAELFSRVGDNRRALVQFRNAIQLDPNNLEALSGAAEASFRLGDYPAAQAYLSRLLHLNGADSEARKLLDVVQTAFLLNPYEKGITQAEKIKRALKAFDIVGNRLQTCSSSDKPSSASSIASFHERWKQLKTTAGRHFLNQHPDEIETLLDFSTSAEKITEAACGEPTVEDSALMAIGNQREGERR